MTCDAYRFVEKLFLASIEGEGNFANRWGGFTLQLRTHTLEQVGHDSHDMDNAT